MLQSSVVRKGASPEREEAAPWLELPLHLRPPQCGTRQGGTGGRRLNL